MRFGTASRPRTVSSGVQTVPQMNFDGWWEVDPQLEARAMVFRTYRQTKPFFAGWVSVVVRVGKSRAVMKSFFQQLQNDSVAISFSKWSAYVDIQKTERQKQDLGYKRFKFFSQLMCLKLWHEAAAAQASARKRVKAIGFRIMNAGLNVCFLTWAANVSIVVQQRGILHRFVALMTKAALADCFAEWSDVAKSTVEQRKLESIMRLPPYWKPPRPQHSYRVTLLLMSHNSVSIVARLYGANTSSDDMPSPASDGQAQLDFIISSFTHLGKRQSLQLSQSRRSISSPRTLTPL
jgi:hypothetical protein